MGIEFSGGFLMAGVVLTTAVTLPLKVGAHLANAQRTGFGACALAAMVGLVAGAIASNLFGGAIGGPLAAALGFAVAIRFILGTSMIGAVGLMIVAIGVSIVGLWVLANLGVVTASAVPAA